MKIFTYTDGGARGNPGPAAIGVVIKNQGHETIKEVGLYIGEATNNEAEYQALIRGIEEALEKKADEITCILDSELIVKQLNGMYKVKNPRMKKFWLRVKELEANFERVIYKHVERKENKEADKLVNQVLDLVENA